MTDDQVLAALDFTFYGDHWAFYLVTLTCGCTFIWSEWFTLHVAREFLDRCGICFECLEDNVRVRRARAI